MNPRVSGLVVSLVAGAMTAPAFAQAVLAQQDLHGHTVRVERARDGTVSLRVDGHATALPGVERDAVATIERVPQGAGTVLVVRARGAAAVIAGASGRAPTVLFAGATGVVGEDVGERHTTEVLVRDFDGVPGPEVVVGERHEDVALCGLGSPLVATQVVDPARLVLVHFGLNPLRADAYAAPMPAATVVDAITLAPGAARPVLAALSFATRVAAGQPATPSANLTDGDASTAWIARRFDFVTSPVTLAGNAAERIVLVAPAVPARLPRELTMLVHGGDATQRIDVRLPDGPIAPGQAVAVPLVPHRTLDCLSIVATRELPDRASAIADVALATALDGMAAPAAELARALDGVHGDAAAMLLLRMGDAGIAALADALPGLAVPGARHAIALLGTTRSVAGARALVAALERPGLEDAARAALEAMGPAALESLGGAVGTDARASRSIRMARAPLDARLRAIAGALSASRETWHAVRPDAVELVREAVAHGQLDAWLACVPANDATGASRALAVAADAAGPDAPARAAIAVRARAVQAVTFDDRFRLLVPLAGDDEGRARVAQIARTDADADLRLQAVVALEASGGDPSTLEQAAGDRVARVRAVAVRGLHGVARARELLIERLRRDPWPSVQRGAAEALAGNAANAGVLLEALDASSVWTVRAAIEALSRTPGTAIGPRLMRFAEDRRDNPDLRAEALDALSARCDAGLSDRLFALFNRENDEMLPPPEQMVGQRALLTLAHVDPARIRRELPRMQLNAVGTSVIQRALRGACPAR